MRQFLTTDIAGAGYTFSAAAKTVTFTGTIPAFNQILAIINVTRGVLIYNPTAVATKGTFASPVLTLAYDTTAHADADVLEIIVDRPQSATPSFADTTVSAVVAANSTTNNVSIACAGKNVVAVNVGAWTSGQYVFEGTVDGSTWVTVVGTVISNGTSTSTVNGGTTGVWSCPVAGFVTFRVRANNAGGVGTPTITLIASSAVGLVSWSNQLVGLASGSNTIGKIQQVRDTGRNQRVFMLDAFTAAPVAEAVQSVVQWYGNAAVAGTTQPAVVPAGKTLRLTAWKIMYQSLATTGVAVVRIRANTAGLAVLASPLVASFEAGSVAAVAGVFSSQMGIFEEGLELPAGTGLAFSMAGYGPTGTLTLEGTTRFMVYGYEY